MTPATLRRMSQTTLDDVYVVGLLDEDEAPVRLLPYWRHVYLEVGASLLELRCVADTGTLLVRAVTEFAEVPWNSDDMRVSVVSLRELVLNDTEASNRISNFRMMGASFGGAEGVTCAAVEIRLENGQAVFIDPSYHFGIRIGGSEQRAAWLINRPGADSLPQWDSHPVG